MSDIFSKLNHVCIVGRDVETAVAYYRSIGLGPWHDYRPLVQYTELDVPSPDAFRGMICRNGMRTQCRPILNG